jgi:hypothetical protein
MGVYTQHMIGKLIAFIVFTHGNKVKSSMFAKKFYGQETSSHRGKYRYRRKGFLDDIKHIKLIRGVIIVKKEEVNGILDFLNQFDTKIFVRNVELDKNEVKFLYGI